MAKILQAIIMAGFDYQGGPVKGVNFGEIAQHRQDLLIAANPQLTVTIMDVGAGMTTVSAIALGADGKPARLEKANNTHKPVTAKNYSKGFGHHSVFDTDPDGRMSITDLYAAVEALGSAGKTQRSLTEVSVFSHGFFGGPILVNSNDNSGSAARDARDKDARAGKDFRDPNMGIGKLAAFKEAFTEDAVWWTWGCSFTESYRQVTDRVVKSPKYRTTPPGKLKDTDKLTFVFPQDMANDIYGDDATFFPQDAGPPVKPKGPPQRKVLKFERSVGDIKAFFSRGVSRCYHTAVEKAGQVQARGAFLGTYADYEKDDKRIKPEQALMEIPRSLKYMKDDFTPYIRMWQNLLGFDTDPEGHGYCVYPK